MGECDLVSSWEGADRFGVTVETVQSWVRRGRIPYIRRSRWILRFIMVYVESAITREAQEGESHVHAEN